MLRVPKITSRMSRDTHVDLTNVCLDKMLRFARPIEERAATCRLRQDCFALGRKTFVSVIRSLSVCRAIIVLQQGHCSHSSC